MRILDIIEKKRDGYPLSDEEIKFFVNGVTNNSIPDYQTSALLMAILFRGMSPREIASLTKAMLYSGDVIDLSSIPGIKVDKHSTGGVGDKTSLALLPLVASCGVKIAKMSGRGLGHTGGTLDKMESVKGTSISLSEEAFKKQVREIGLAINGQTAEIDPADKKLYALRDVTGTVPSIPLIASSIMSKKLASGSNAILLDVKFGSGAFMKDLKSARELAKTMVQIGDNLGRETIAILTDMDEPLGFAIGNSLEVKEAIDTLLGRGPKDFTTLILKAGGIMLYLGKKVVTPKDGEKLIEKAIKDGSGFQKLLELFSYQGGDISYLKDPSKFPVAKNIVTCLAKEEGYIKHIDSLSFGEGAMHLGAGRSSLEDEIDLSAGIILKKKVGDKVSIGDPLFEIHTNKENYLDVIKDLEKAITYSRVPLKERPIVHEMITKEDL